jgi:predicted transposase/invertase (TIGR01784 family)
MQDKLWKNIIEELFPDFLAFFLPELVHQVDFTRPHQFLDKEFETLFANAQGKQGRRFVDKLAKVFLKEGQEQWVLVHTEIQGYPDKSFEQRMFTYFYRVFDRYQQSIAAIAVFTDDRPGWKPDRFEYQFNRTGLSYYYPVYKVLDQDEEALKASDNPFAQVVLATLYALRSKRQPDRFKYRFKVELTQLLFKKGFESTRIRAVFQFLDCLIQLEDSLLQDQFFEEAHQMATTQEEQEIIGDFQKVAMRRGHQVGWQEGRHENQELVALKMLAEGFDDALIAKLTDLSLAEIAALKARM